MQRVKTEVILRGAIGLLLLGLLAVITDSLRERLVVVGDRAPDFSITADNGGVISRSDFGGKLLVLNFWATWCPPCVEEIPSLNRFQQHFSGKGVVVLGISVDKDEEAYQRFLRQAGVSFRTARDTERRINLEYGTVKFPETYIIGADGTVLRKIISSRDWMAPEMLADVESLLRM